MRRGVAIYTLALAAAVVLLVGCLTLWLYLPGTGASSRQIAQALFDYQTLTSTNGRGALGTVLPLFLMLHNFSNLIRESGPDFAGSGYSYHRLGIYFERYFDLKRDLPGGNTWTLTTTVRMCPPTWITQREFWWTQRLITISNGPLALPGYSPRSNAVPGDLVIRRNLPGTWHVTAYASENGWNQTLQIATNGDYSAVGYFATDEDGSKESGKVKVENGCLLMTITNQIIPLPGLHIQEPPYTLRRRVLYADTRRVLVSANTNASDIEFLMEKQMR